MTPQLVHHGHPESSTRGSYVDGRMGHWSRHTRGVTPCMTTIGDAGLREPSRAGRPRPV